MLQHWLSACVSGCRIPVSFSKIDKRRTDRAREETGAENGRHEGRGRRSPRQEGGHSRSETGIPTNVGEILNS